VPSLALTILAGADERGHLFMVIGSYYEITITEPQGSPVFCASFLSVLAGGMQPTCNPSLSSQKMQFPATL
jgi:hypothetical protein